MPALQRQFLPDAPPPSRAEILELVSSGSLGEVLRPASDGAASPAHALQQRLLDAYVEGPARAVRPERLPLPVRGAIILGLSVSLWLGIGGAALLVLGLM